MYEDDGRRYLVYQRGDARGPRAQHSGHLAGDRGLDAEGLRAGIGSSSPRAELAEGADTVYVNGDSVIPCAKAIEPLFQERMFAGVHLES